MNNQKSTVRSITWKMKLLLIFLSIGLTVAALEITIRIAGINDQFTRKAFSKNLLQISDNPVLIYELKPGGSSSIDGVANNISSQGLRDRVFEIPKPPGVQRIIALGDSVTYGLGVRLEDTFAKQLENLLSEEKTASRERWEVLNMGVNGYKTVQEIEHLKVDGLKFEPDVVILSYNLNDPGDFSRELPYFNSWQNRQWTSETMSLPARIRARLSQFSELMFMIEYRTLRLKLGKLADQKPADTSSQRRNYDGYFHLYNNTQAMHALESALDDLQQMASNHHFKVMLAVFPLLMDFDNYKWMELHDRIREMANQREFCTIELLPILRSRVGSAKELQRRYDDFEHPNPLGHRIAAEALLESLTDCHFLMDPQSDLVDSEEYR